MKKFLIASGVAVLAFASVAAAQTFTANLTVGSTGADVVALQTALINGGFNIPAIAAGTAKGYFGSQTVAAVKAYQTAHGVPSTGFVGPLTRTALNGSAGSMGSAGSNCALGWTSATYSGTSYCVPPGMQLPPGSQPGTLPPVGGQTGITTIGVPGLMSVTSGPLSSTVLNVGAQMAPIMTLRVQAQYSDLAVQNVTLDLGNNTGAYNKIFNKIYVMNGSSVLASQPLNTTTVVQSGNSYIVGISGFNFIVPKGTYKDLTIAADLNSSIDSTYLASGSHYPDGTHATLNNIAGSAVTGWGIGLGSQQLRAVDGAGLNLYNSSVVGPQGLVINASLVDNATANILSDGTSPTTNVVPVSNTASGLISKLPIFAFGVNAQSDTLHLHNFAVNISGVGNGATSGATTTSAYLMQGSTLVASANITNGVATFSNINDGTAGATIPVNTTQTYTVAVDVSGLLTGSIAITASTNAAGTTIYNSQDSTVSAVGSAVGNTITVAGSGPIFTLTSAPTLPAVAPQGSGTSLSTSTLVANFNLSIGAVGTSVLFGTTGSTSPAFLFNVIDNNGNTIYSGYGQGNSTGVVSNTGSLNGTATVIPTIPTQFAVTGTTTSFMVSNGQATPLNLGTVSFQFNGRTQNGSILSTNAPYKVTLAGIRYYNVTTGTYATSTFMNGLSTWTTPPVTP